MAIPPKQIGSSNKANILWEISKQLERLTCVLAGGCSTTTTTTTTAIPLVLINGLFSYEGCVPCETSCLLGLITLYTEQSCVDTITVGCHVYSDSEGTTNATEGYYVRWDETPGFLYIDSNGLVLNIDTCPQPRDNLINTNYTFVDCGIINNCPGEAPCAEPLNYFNVWMLESCTFAWPNLGCEVWLDINGSIPFSSGLYPKENEIGCIEIDNGVVISVI